MLAYSVCLGPSLISLIAATVLGEIGRFLQQFLFELGPNAGKSLLKPRIGCRPKNSRNKLIAGVNSSVNRTLFKNKPPIHSQLSFLETVTSGHSTPRAHSPLVKAL